VKAARILPVAASLLVLVALWQGAIAVFGIPPFVLPSLGAILKHAASEAGPLSAALGATLLEASSGYLLGALCGLLLAMLMVLVRPLQRCLMPLCVAVNSVPIVAYAPLCLIWFGMGPASKIVLIALAVGFTILVNALHGLQLPEEAAINLMRSFGASSIGIMRRLRLPAAMPSVVSGLRVAVPRSMIVAIVGEMLGAYKGLGRVIYESTQQVNLLNVWAAVLFASLASMLLYGLLVWIDRKLVWWR